MREKKPGSAIVEHEVYDIFLSYAREDQGFADRLASALETAGLRVWIDRQRIRPTAEWLEEIHAAITSSNLIAFVLSPDFLASEICGLELDHAVRRGKRLAPLLVRKGLEELELPGPLAARNWIPFDSPDLFDESVSLLVEAATTDLDHVRQHTRLLIRAEEWQSNQRDFSYLLRGKDLEKAENWMRAPGEPLPVPIQKDYVEAGRQAALRRARLMLALTLLAALALGVFAAIAATSRTEAGRRKEQELARRLASDASASVDLERGVLLAIESLLRAPSWEADRALRRGIELLAPRIRKRDFPREMWDLAFSADGQVLAATARGPDFSLWQWSRDVEPSQLNPTGSILRTIYSDDRRFAALLGEDRTVTIVEIATRRRIASPDHPRNVSSAAFSSDNRYLATGSWDRQVRIWEVATGRLLASLPQEGVINSVDFHPDGRFLVSGSPAPEMLLWDWRQRRIVQRFPVEAAVDQVSFSPAGEFIAVGMRGGKLEIREATSGRLLQARSSAGEIRAMDLDAAGRRLAFGTSEGRIYLDRMGDDTTPRVLLHGSAITALSFSPDGEMLASAGMDGTARVWRTSSAEEIARMPHRVSVESVAFHPGGRLVATAAGGEVSIWTLERDKDFRELPGPSPVGVAFGPGSRIVVVASEDSKLRTWRVSDLGQVGEAALGTRATLIQVHPEIGVATADGSRTIRFWNLPSLESAGSAEFSDNVEAFTIHPGGKLLAVATRDHHLLVREIRTGREIFHQELEYAGDSLAFGRNEELVVSSSNRVEVWDLKRGRVFAREEAEFALGLLNLDGAGGMLATASVDQQVRLWEFPHLKPAGELGHDGPIPVLAYAPDGQHLATVSEDGWLRVWNTKDLREVARLPAFASYDSRVLAFSPDGTLLAARHPGGGVRLWRWRQRDLIALACSRVTRGLLPQELSRYSGSGLQAKACTDDRVSEPQ